MTNEETHKLHRLYEFYEQPMYRIAFAVLKNPYDAEDVVSEAFMRIIKRLENIKNPSSPKTKAYVVKVIKSTSTDIYRKTNIFWKELNSSMRALTKKFPTIHLT